MTEQNQIMFNPITFTGVRLIGASIQYTPPEEQIFNLIGTTTTGTEYILVPQIHVKYLPAVYSEALQNPYGRISSCIIKNYRESPQSWYASVNLPSQFPKFRLDSNDVKRYFHTNVTEFLAPIYGSLSDIMQRWLIGNLACRMSIIGCKGIAPFLAELFHVSARTVSRDKLMVLYQFDPLDYPKESDRYPGGGRKTTCEEYPDIKSRISDIIRDSKYNSPMGKGPMHQSMSQRKIADELKKQGISVSHTTIGNILEEMGYSKKQNKKDMECGHSRTHEEQRAIDDFFDLKSNFLKRYISLGRPTTSVDTKKKEIVGCLYNDGKVYCPNGEFIHVLDHDFPTGIKIVPFGVYCPNLNTGFVNLGTSKDTPEFAADSLRRWLDLNLRSNFPNQNKLLLLSDGGGSNGSRVRLWKKELINISDQYNIEITVFHFPPGKSRYNIIEHRLFSEISKNWAGLPLYSIQHAQHYIEGTTTTTGLSVTCEISNSTYETGIKVSDKEYKALLERIRFIGPKGLEKNVYIIKPRT